MGRILFSGLSSFFQDEFAKVAVLNKFLNIILQGIAVLGVVFMISIKAAIFALVVEVGGDFIGVGHRRNLSSLVFMRMFVLGARRGV